MIFLVKSTFCRQIRDPVRMRSDHEVPLGKFEEVHFYFGGSSGSSPYSVIFKLRNNGSNVGLERHI